MAIALQYRLHEFPFLSFFFFFTVVLKLDSFTWKWQAITAADLNPQYISSNSTFSYNAMTFLCFLEVFPASLVALRVCPIVLYRVYGIALNMMKNTWAVWEISFSATQNLLERWIQAEVISSWCFKWILAPLELTAIATKGGYKISVVPQYILQ